ncbi:MAG: type II toxin-antitoxin system HicA family toxin [Candidatus Hydrogenedentes bacterium]|nr:type II toxin-antitoxin system HicA family toxin [Candidatus Hydrogenedentota bacterium]
MSRLPSLKPREVVAILKKNQFVEIRQSGSHLVLRDSKGHEVVVPMHSRELKRSTLLSIVQQAGYTADSFRKLL